MKLYITAVLFAVLVTISAKYKKNDAAIDAFAARYINQLQGNPKAEAIFAIANIPAAESAKVYQKTLFEFLQHRGAPDAAELSRGCAETVFQNYDRTSPAQLMSLVGHNLAFSLDKKGSLPLDTASASQLATQAAQDLLSGAGDVSTPEGQVLAILNGYEKFWERFGHDVPEMARIVVPFASKMLRKQMM